MDACPICQQRLGDDQLIAIWYAPCGWYVLYHVEAEKVAPFHDNIAHGKPEVEFSRCAEAGFQMRRAA